MGNASRFLPDLPADHYGVHVENDMDARRLLYLVEKIGVEKIAGSASRYSQKWPGSNIFVSELLRRYRIKVPAHIFAPVNVPIYRVYLLLHSASAKLKVGFAGHWLSRVASLACDFDLDRSVGFNFGGDKVNAIAAERMVKGCFQSARTKPPPVRYGAFGHKEWFSATIIDDASVAISNFNTQQRRDFLTLREALFLDIFHNQESPAALQGRYFRGAYRPPDSSHR